MKWRTRIPALAIWVTFLAALSGLVSPTVQPAGVTEVLTQQEQHLQGQVASKSGQTALPPLPIVKSFPTHTRWPRGLEYAEGHLYYASAKWDVPDEIFKVDPETGKLVKTYPWTCNDFPIGIAWDGENFYVSDDTTEEDFAGKTVFICKVDRDFKLVKKLPPPAPWLRDMAYDGESLFVASSYEEKIYVLDPETGSVRDHFPLPHSDKTPMDHPEGLAWDGKYFWLANNAFDGDDYIYKLDPKTKPWGVVEQYKAPGPEPTGLAFDGQYLWVVDWEEAKNYQLDIGFIPTPPAQKLEANVPKADQEIGPGPLVLIDPKTQYFIEVPAEAKLLAVKLDSQAEKGNVDMYIRHKRPVERSGKIIIADYHLISDGNEFIIINNPKPGTYYIAIGNPTPTAQKFTIIATPVADIVALKAGKPADGQVDPNAGLLPFLRQYLETRAGLLGLTQYKFVVPKEAKSIKIQLFGPRDKNLDLHLRYGKPVEIRPDGGLDTDLSLPGPTGEEAVIISGTLLRPEALYIAVESLEKDKQSFKILVTVDTGGGLQTFVFQ